MKTTVIVDNLDGGMKKWVFNKLDGEISHLYLRYNKLDSNWLEDVNGIAYPLKFSFSTLQEAQQYQLTQLLDKKAKLEKQLDKINIHLKKILE